MGKNPRRFLLACKLKAVSPITPYVLRSKPGMKKVAFVNFFLGAGEGRKGPQGDTGEFLGKRQGSEGNSTF